MAYTFSGASTSVFSSLDGFASCFPSLDGRGEQVFVGTDLQVYLLMDRSKDPVPTLLLLQKFHNINMLQRLRQDYLTSS